MARQKRRDAYCDTSKGRESLINKIGELDFCALVNSSFLCANEEEVNPS